MSVSELTPQGLVQYFQDNSRARSWSDSMYKCINLPYPDTVYVAGEFFSMTLDDMREDPLGTWLRFLREIEVIGDEWGIQNRTTANLETITLSENVIRGDPAGSSTSPEVYIPLVMILSFALAVAMCLRRPRFWRWPRLAKVVFTFVLVALLYVTSSTVIGGTRY